MSGGMTADERDAIERFPIVAEEFCHLVDDCGKGNRKQLVQELAVHLARLCEVAVCLPNLEPGTEGVDHTIEGVAAPPQECFKTLRNFRQTFGQFDGYL